MRTFAQFLVGGQLLVRLVPGDPQVLGRRHHDRHAVVDARHLDAVDHVHLAAGRQQAAGGRARRVLEPEHDGRGRSRHPGDGGAAPVVDAPAGRGEARGGRAAGVEQADAHLGVFTARRDQPAFDGERADAGQQVPAVLRRRDDRLVHGHLEEQVVEVGRRIGARRHHGDFAGQRMRAADAVDLARVGAPQGAQQQVVALHGIGGQVGRQEVRALRGAAAHQHAAHALIGHCRTPPRSRT